MYRYEEVKTVHLEITSKCNARCPMCLRTVCGGKNNPHLPLVELNLEQIKKIFRPNFISQLRRIYMCGNYGDPLFAKDTLESFEYFRQQNSEMRLEMFTNGSAKSPDWWRRLAQTIDLVHFSVDGLEDTNHLYRKGTHFPTIIKSMQAYLEAGGEAVWDFIVFQHNEHQIEEVKALSKELGFKKINIKKTGRFFSNSQLTRKHQQEVLDKNGEVDYYIAMPEAKEYQNTALAKEEALVEKYGSLEEYLNQTPIQCKVAKEKSLYISAMGRAWPCCWTANQLYPWYFPKEKSYMWKLLGKLENGADDLSVLDKELRDVVDGPFFHEVLLKSWELKSIKEGRPKCCAKTCGTDFDPFRAQFT